ncbi:MAG: ABC transporter ATP-binding protein [Planctomycetota bacterium]|jgi:ABC-2 type transport system ATP-binding protein
MQDIIIQTRQLTKYYGKTLALDHLDLQVPRGCIYGFLGRNGSGKTTAIKLMLGLLRPTTGSASVLGCDSQSLTPETRGQIGYVTEGHRLYRWMKIGALEKFQKAFFPDRWNSGLFDEMLGFFDLSKKQKIKSLSNGQRAQVSLALTMAPDPDVMIMDDPTLGLDVVIRRQFLEGMIHLIQKKGKTILFSSHILGDVERVADRIAVIEQGVLRADCTLDEFRQKIRKVHFVFEDHIPETIDIPGLLHKRQNHNHMELTLVGTTDAQIQQAVETAGAKEYKMVELNLEDQFIEFTAREKSKPLFQWEA